MRNSYLYLFIVISLLLLPNSLAAQDSLDTINVFLDCRRACNESFVREEIQFVNYVRNVEDSDVHLLIISQRTSNGGEEFTLQFIGENMFSGIDKTDTYFSAESDTEVERRTGLNHRIKLGLLPYLTDRPIADRFSINYIDADIPDNSQSNLDKWNYWVFDINADTDLEGEKSEKNFSLNGRVSAERITPDWKFEFQMDNYFERQTFKDDSVESTFTSESRGADLLLVKSLNEHWSAGISTRANHSTRNNYNLLLEGSPAIEYSVFPYREFTRRQITFKYRLTGGYYDYNEVTVYGQNSEYLMKQQLTSDIQFTQPWGEFEARVNGSAYLHDFTKNRIDTEVRLDFRIYRGFSVYMSGEYAWINNQLSIPAGEITEQEQLLDLRELATSYSYELRFGLQFSFGSIYNNVVNPRLSNRRDYRER